MTVQLRFLLALILLAPLAACTGPGPTTPPAPTSTQPVAAPESDAPPETTDVYWPTGGWRTSTPEAQGMDSRKLEAMVEAIEERGINLHSVVVVRHGYIVAETYYGSYRENTQHVQYSVTKSVVSALLGIAVEQRIIEDLDRPVLSYFSDRTIANQDPRKEAMTLEHLVAMTSGIEWSDDRNIDEMWRSSDWVQYMLDRPMAEEPGAGFNYNSGSTHLLSAVIQLTTGETVQVFAQEHLFDPLGIRPEDIRWETDRDGISIGGWGLWMTSRDMARFGYLYLKEGAWEGRQVVPAEWVRASAQPRVRVDDAKEPWALYYGYGWWAHELGAYAAHGRGGQFIFVIPDLDMVVVFTADLAGDEFVQPELLLRDYIMPAAF